MFLIDSQAGFVFYAPFSGCNDTDQIKQDLYPISKIRIRKLLIRIHLSSIRICNRRTVSVSMAYH